MKRYLAIATLLCSTAAHAQTIDGSYKDYDFRPGEKTIFEDKFIYAPNEKITDHWQFLDGGGAASIQEKDGEKVLSFDAYYTRLKPKIFGNKSLPEDFSVEYDAWLDPGYDGNPGVVIVFKYDDEATMSVTPNKHALGVTLPNNESVNKDNPSEYFDGVGRFYNRWVHISIAVHKKMMNVYLDQYKMLEIPDILKQPKFIAVYGDASSNGDNKLPIYMKNFRLATGFPASINFENGKFVTRNIRFDVNKAILKPESISILKQVKGYMDTNPSIKIEIGGHTDSDGTDDFNQKLSQQRADAVKDQLVSMGIAASRLTAKGFGESSPVDNGNTPEAKATNRRVEFVILK